MSFSNEWELAFGQGTHDSRWPWSDLVSMTRRYARTLGSQSKVLEIGCGVGANIPFLLSTGAQYFAVEGSDTAARKVRERFPPVSDRIWTGDFTARIPFEDRFDLIIDRAAMTHNDEQSIRQCLAHLATRLTAGGRYIGIDWFSTSHDGFRTGAPAADGWTRQGFESGPFAGVGRVHFSDEAHLRDLFAGWQWLALEEKVVHVSLPQPTVLASWNFALSRP